MPKPLEEWTVEELRAEATRVLEELVRRAAAPAQKKKGVDVVHACENWVHGLGWDETFTREMVEDELAILARKSGRELARLDRERLVQLWLAEYDRRYRAA
jgi:hypothetical protein